MTCSCNIVERTWTDGRIWYFFQEKCFHVFITLETNYMYSMSFQELLMNSF